MALSPEIQNMAMQTAASIIARREHEEVKVAARQEEAEEIMLYLRGEGFDDEVIQETLITMGIDWGTVEYLELEPMAKQDGKPYNIPPPPSNPPPSDANPTGMAQAGAGGQIGGQIGSQEAHAQAAGLQQEAGDMMRSPDPEPDPSTQAQQEEAPPAELNTEA